MAVNQVKFEVGGIYKFKYEYGSWVIYTITEIKDDYFYYIKVLYKSPNHEIDSFKIMTSFSNGSLIYKASTVVEDKPILELLYGR